MVSRTPLFDRLLILTSTLQKICRVAYGEYKVSGTPVLGEIALMTGMLICAEETCKNKAYVLVQKKPYCKNHAEASKHR
jgi:hypothetical protein